MGTPWRPHHLCDHVSNCLGPNERFRTVLPAGSVFPNDSRESRPHESQGITIQQGNLSGFLSEFMLRDLLCISKLSHNRDLSLGSTAIRSRPCEKHIRCLSCW